MSLIPQYHCASQSQQPIHWWRGETGNWYIHTIFSINNLPEIECCNYILARPSENGYRYALYNGQTGDGSNRLTISQHEKFRPAINMGATEVHVHLLAQSEKARFEIETDLRRSLKPPLNRQSIPAVGLGALSKFGTLAPLPSPATPYPGLSLFASLCAPGSGLAGSSLGPTAPQSALREIPTIMNRLDGRERPLEPFSAGYGISAWLRGVK
jgi:hypothetical protein